MHTDMFCFLAEGKSLRQGAKKISEMSNEAILHEKFIVKSKTVSNPRATKFSGSKTAGNPCEPH